MMQPAPLTLQPHEGQPPAAADRVVILAPAGRDGPLAAELLRETDIHAEVCPSAERLAGMLEAGAGALLLTEEALVPSVTDPLTAWLRAQPTWSDLPVILCIDAQHSQEETRRIVGLMGGNSNVVLLDRPLRINTLRTVVQASLHARSRQYDVRDLLGRLTDVNGELRTLNIDLERRVQDRTRALEARTEEVQELAAALTYAEQQERARIAEVLHDHLQQLVFGIQLKVQMIRGAEGDMRAGLIDQAENLAHEAMEATRTLTVELNPPVIGEDDFEVIVQWLAAHFEETHGLEVEIVSEGACEIHSRELRSLLAQSVRELLFNTAKHAGVDEARVRLEKTGDDLCIHVEDDGRGFDPHDLDGSGANGGFGLYSVRERMRLFGADLTIDTAPGNGTHLTLRIPCDVATGTHLPTAVGGRALSSAPAAPPAGPSTD